MIRIVFMTSLAGLFTAVAANYATAQSDCSSRDIACTANCQTLPEELSGDCQAYCFKDREECEERAKQNERALLEKQQRRREGKKLRRREKGKRKQ
jgi:hypothetical protein